MDTKLEIKLDNGVITVESMVAVMKRMAVLGTKEFEEMQEKNRKGNSISFYHSPSSQRCCQRHDRLRPTDRQFC